MANAVIIKSLEELLNIPSVKFEGNEIHGGSGYIFEEETGVVAKIISGDVSDNELEVQINQGDDSFRIPILFIKEFITQDFYWDEEEDDDW